MLGAIRREVTELLKGERVIDLIYDSAAWPEIKKAVPSATREDASDSVHPDRIQVRFPDEHGDVYYKAAIRRGYSEVSINFQLMLMRTEGQAKIRGWCAELKAEDSPKSEES